MNQHSKTHLYINVVTFIIVTTYFIVSLCNLLMIWYDSAQGFLTYFNTITDGPFNFWRETDLDTGDFKYVFNSITTPGQYIFPAIFYSIGFNLGTAISITVYLLCLSAIWGYNKVFTIFGFDKNIAAICTFLILSSRYINFHYNTYNGGVILTLTLFPFFILAFIWLFEKKVFMRIIGSVLLFIIGFILKQSFLVFELAIVLYLCWLEFDKYYKTDKITLLGRVFLWGASFIVSYFLIDVLYLSKGWHANSAQAYFKGINFESLMIILICYLESIISAFSPGDLIKRIFYHPISPILPPLPWLIDIFYLSLLVFATVIFLYTKKVVHKSYLQLVSSFLIVTTAMMSYFHLKGAALNDFDERYFRNSSILFLPVFVSFIVQKYKPTSIENMLKIVLILFISASVIYSSASYYVRTKQNSVYPIGIQNIRQIVSQNYLNKIHEIDSKYPKFSTIILSQSQNPCILLDIQNQKNLFLHDGPSFLKMAQSNYKFEVKGYNIFLFMEKKYATSNPIIIAQMFEKTEINKWTYESIDDEVILLSYIKE